MNDPRSFLVKLAHCKSKEDFSTLCMESIQNACTDASSFPNRRQVALVDHLGSFTLDQIKDFFEKIHSVLAVPFWIEAATSVNMAGKTFHRYSLYADSEALASSFSEDKLYRFQDPAVEQEKGLTIDLKDFSLTFNDEGELLRFARPEDANSAIQKARSEYWSKTDNPEIIISDSLSENPRSRWMLEALSQHLTAMDSHEQQARLANGIAKFIPELELGLMAGDYIPFVASLKIATAMNQLEFPVQDKIIRDLILHFGFFDSFIGPE